MIKKLILVLTSIWWGWTALTDFAVVPTVFSSIPDFFVAGELGIAVFSKLNLLELVLSSALMTLSILYLKHQRRGKMQLLLVSFSWMIVMFYNAYLTDKIVMLTELWKKADAANQLGIASITDIQQEHQFYHRMYIALDSFKLLFLTGIIGLGLFGTEKTLENS